MNLYRSAAYVRQYTSSWCTGAATQMMGNLIRLRSNPGAWVDRWSARQRDIVRYAKARDTLRESNGTDPQGWAAALRGYGMGSTYKWQAFADFDAALHQAVVRMRATGRPVGLLAWSGRHAWVLHGFTATADPATTDAFRVTQVRVSGPLKGTDPINGAFTPSQLRPRWGRYAERDGYLGWVGDFVLIAP
jgi:hypothetical protein